VKHRSLSLRFVRGSQNNIMMPFTTV
jgi:hypothetical protein